MSNHTRDLEAYLRLRGNDVDPDIRAGLRELPGAGDHRPTSRPAPDPDDDENDDFFDPQVDDDASRERP